MNVYILNTSLEIIEIIDDYYSLIWASRYCEIGEFEIELPIDYNTNPAIELGNFVVIPSSDIVMIIEEKKTSFDLDKETILVSGESTESFLKRRWFEGPKNVNGSVESYLYGTVLSTFVNNPVTARNISILSGTELATNYPLPNYITQIGIGSIYDFFTSMCKATGMGYKIVWLQDSAELAFIVYRGVDRSTEQSTVPPVIFAREFDNIISAEYVDSEKDVVNIVKVFTDDLVFDSVDVWWLGLPAPPLLPEPAGLERYESVLELSIDRNIDPENPLGDLEVQSIIYTKGMEVIHNNSPRKLIDGDFDISGNFKYGVDFFMGDVIQVYFNGVDTPARVVELIQSYSNNEVKTYIAVDFITINEI